MTINIQTVKWTNEENTLVCVNDNIFVPADDKNKEWRKVQKWVQDGNSISPFIPPVGPTNDEKIETSNEVLKAFIKVYGNKQNETWEDMKLLISAEM